MYYERMEIRWFFQMVWYTGTSRTTKRIYNYCSQLLYQVRLIDIVSLIRFSLRLTPESQSKSVSLQLYTLSRQVYRYTSYSYKVLNAS